jgi:excisionase family DNA binding protein
MTHDLDPEKLSYNVIQAAAATGVSRATIWSLIKEGELESFKWGGRTLIRRDVLQRSLDRASGHKP